MPLPLGTSTFSALRASGEIYVDKTAQIFELARLRAKVFLARPRRFGKSLLLSTFASLFAHGLRDFAGLDIEKKWHDDVYPVVRLDFSGATTFRSADQYHVLFTSLVSVAFAPLGFRFNEKSSVPFGIQLREWLSGLADNSIVLLIDEYDAPLTEHLDNKEAFEVVREEMNDFFKTLKACEGCLRFFFMTGITKFSSTNIFSAFNNLNDISLNPRYGTLLGWTQAELCANFAGYIDRAARASGVKNEEILRGLQENYDGFCFDQNAALHVFCPWSVLNYFQYPELGFENYWYESGGKPSVLMKYLANHALASPQSFDAVQQVNIIDLKSANRYDDVSLEVLLTQAGYFSIRGVNNNVFELGYPNREVRLSMAQLYARELLKGRVLSQSKRNPIERRLADGTIGEVVDCFNEIMNAIDYAGYPISNEAVCRAYLQVLLIGAALRPQVEVHSARGRSDLEVEAGDRRWVFEIKYAAKTKDVAPRLEEAVEQIRSRRYGETPHGRRIIRAALVFDGAERRFAAFEEV